jgi:lysophospholipase L1-like esterase
MPRHEAKLKQGKAGPVDLVFVGDSITQNYEKAGPAPDQVFAPIWDEYFAPHHALNLGFSGDRTEQVLWRLDHGEVDGLHPHDVVLLIGTNNTAKKQTAADTALGSIAVIDELHQKLPAARLLVLDILPSDSTPEKEAADAEVNRTVRAHYAGMTYVRFLDLTSIFVKDGKVDRTLYYDGIKPPPAWALHPNTEGQRKMAQAVAAALYGPQ